MKILIVCREKNGKIAPFIKEQAYSILSYGLEVKYCTIEEAGLKGYIKSFFKLKKILKQYMPDIIHAHYGLSGLVANFQRKIPVVTTYHGSDINMRYIYLFSKINMILSKMNIFVSKKHYQKAEKIKNKFIIPCGVDIEIFKPIDKIHARKALGLNFEKKYILFSGSFNNKVKNSPLAIEAVKALNDNTELIELKGFSRNEVMLLMNAADLSLLTSFSEGSPQFVKEAMACNCPIVSVDVGDVKQVIENTEQSLIAKNNIFDIAEKITIIIQSNKRSNGREMLIAQKLDLESVAQKIISLYNNLLK